MSDTPRTDAVIAKHRGLKTSQYAFDLRDLARQLERELASRPEVVQSVRESIVTIVRDGKITVPAMLFRDGEKVDVMVTPYMNSSGETRDDGP
jgi:hypothetical protein